MARKRIKRKKKKEKEEEFWLLTMYDDNNIERHQIIEESDKDIAYKEAEKFLNDHSEFKNDRWKLTPQSYWGNNS